MGTALIFLHLLFEIMSFRVLDGIPAAKKDMNIVYLGDSFKHNHFIFTSILEGNSHFDEYFSKRLKPPSSCNFKNI